MIYDVAIIGGGASGFFTANLLLEKNPDFKILILEKTGKILQKVKVSGGGRCNVTHNEMNQTSFAKNYPRGNKFFKKSLRIFGAQEMINWLQSHNVELKTEDDNRMFPVSNTSQTIIDCFGKVLKNKNCKLIFNQSLLGFESSDNKITIETKSGSFESKKLVLACGSSSQVWKLLEGKGVEIVPPVASLFTFKLENHPMKGLEGVSLASVKIKVVGEKLQQSGPWLITHQGISGPAVLKTSAYGARELFAKNYSFDLMINFTNFEKLEDVQRSISEQLNSKKMVINTPLFGISKRLWKYFVDRANILESKTWLDISKKEKNKLIEELYQGNYKVNGKNTFKDEFVTAGGLDISEIKANTCELIKIPNVYAVGEFLNVDGVTGGFNFQSCWTTSFLACEGISN